MPKLMYPSQPHPEVRPTPAKPGCVIYCRVSSRKQVSEGDGLNGQEKRCRDYAAARGYTVLNVFSEDITGAANQRQAMSDMLAFLQDYGSELVVIVDDIKRFAREVRTHFDLKAEIYARGGRLESPLFRFEDTPEGKFVETVMAAQAELERNQNARQVAGRMKARLEQGYWTFRVPAGYCYKRHPLHKKIMAPDGERAEVVREALNGFASARFCGGMDVWRFLADKGFFGAEPDRALLSNQLTFISGMLRQILYAGHLEYHPWGIGLRKAQHPALITLSTYYQIQDRLRDKARTRFPVGARKEFPLRGVVHCALCLKPLTGSWSRSRMKRRYPYYHCMNRACGRYGATIRQALIEDAFRQILKDVRLSDEAMQVLYLRVTERCKALVADEAKQATLLEGELSEIEESLNQLADRLGRTTSDTVALALEGRIEELVRRQVLVRERLADGPNSMSPDDVGTLFRQVRAALQNPLQEWEAGSIETKKLVTQRVFTSPLPYDRETGFGTPELTLPYTVLRQLAQPDCDLVDPKLDAWEQLVNHLQSWERYKPLDVEQRAE